MLAVRKNFLLGDRPALAPHQTIIRGFRERAWGSSGFESRVRRPVSPGKCHFSGSCGGICDFQCLCLV
jgi:hypothetical protein